MAWKRFNFFDKTLLAAPQDADDLDSMEFRANAREMGVTAELGNGEPKFGPYRLLQSMDTLSFSTARGRMAFGCHMGIVAIVSGPGQLLRRWRPHMTRVPHMQLLHSADVLMTLGDSKDIRGHVEAAARRAASKEAIEELTRARAWPHRDGLSEPDVPTAAEDAFSMVEIRPTLSLWRLDPSESEWPPSLARRIQIDVDAAFAPAITAVCVSEDLKLAAVGFANGAVVLVRGDLHHARAGAVTQTTIQLPLPRKDVGRDVDDAAWRTGRSVTGLFFSRHSEGSLLNPVLEGLTPSHDDGTDSDSHESRRIVVLYIVTEQGVSAVFPGDIVPAEMRHMVKRSGNRAADFLPTSFATPDEDDEKSFTPHMRPGGVSVGTPYVSPAGPRVDLLEEGVALGCSCLSSNGVLVVAVDSGVKVIAPRTAGITFGYPGVKRRIAWRRGRLALVTVSSDRETLVVFDVLNQLVILTFLLPTMKVDVSHSATSASLRAPTRARSHCAQSLEFGRTNTGSSILFLVVSDGTVLLFREKSARDQLALLKEVRRYDVAVKVARSSPEFGPKAVAEILKEQADLAYRDGQLRRSAELFCETIGFVEPSHVVKSFLAASHTQYLMTYLEVLHQTPFVAPEHTTLLINCYTRAASAAGRALGDPADETAVEEGEDEALSGGEETGDVGPSPGGAQERLSQVCEKLRAFVRGSRVKPLKWIDDDSDDEDQQSSASGGGTFLDVPRALSEIRLAARTVPVFTAIALALAVRTDRHSDAVSLWLESATGSGWALQYIRALPFDIAERMMLEFGAQLLASRPADTTSVMVDLCTGWVPDVSVGRIAASRALEDDAADVAAWERRLAKVIAHFASEERRDVSQPSKLLSRVGKYIPMFLPPADEGLDDDDVATTLLQRTLAAKPSMERRGIAPIDVDAIPLLHRPGVATRSQHLLDAQLKHLLVTVAKHTRAPPLDETSTITLLELGLRDGVGGPGDDVLPASASDAGSDESVGLARQLVMWRPLTVDMRRERRKAIVIDLILSRPERCPVDLHSALVLCRRYQYSEGTMWILRRLRTTGPLSMMEVTASSLRAAVAKRDWDSVSEVREQLEELCADHSTNNPQLWVHALGVLVETFIGRSDTVSLESGGRSRSDCSFAEHSIEPFPAGDSLADEEESRLRTCVDQVLSLKLMTSLQVVELLSRNRRIPLRVVKAQLERSLMEAEFLAAEDERATRGHRAATDMMRSELHDLRTRGRVFRRRESRQSLTTLDYPSVHFLCGRILNGERLDGDIDQEHSYSCSELDDPTSCPICRPHHESILSTKVEVDRSAVDVDGFESRLDDADDRIGGFPAIAEFLGKGATSTFIRVASTH
jgi:hypothetical protein